MILFPYSKTIPVILPKKDGSVIENPLCFTCYGSGVSILTSVHGKRHE